VKMNLRWLAVALLLGTTCVPASLMATASNFNGAPAPSVQHPAPPPDGNPWPRMKGTPAPNVQNPAPPPDGNPWPR